MSPDHDHVLTSAEELLLAELDRRAAPTRAQATAGMWVYGSVEDLVIQRGRWYLPNLAPALVGGISGAATQARERRATYVEGFLYGVDDQVRTAAWVANGDVIVAGTAGGLAFLGVPLDLEFVDMVRRRSGAASVLHGQQLDRWRLVEFGLPRNATAGTTG
ncbi:hypothetical protein [Kutzneria sp. NPDC051319]|uniref:hypothetical protein n=1 Tax=Kutzneria sp. NPDC051319 TaxID=3155047 RepID=UPI0034341496